MLEIQVSDAGEAYSALISDIPLGTYDLMPKDIAAVSAANAVVIATASSGGYPAVATDYMALTTAVQAHQTLPRLQNANITAVQTYENACIDLTGVFPSASR